MRSLRRASTSLRQSPQDFRSSWRSAAGELQCICTYIHIYIYIYKNVLQKHNSYISIHIYIYIYIHIHVIYLLPYTHVVAAQRYGTSRYTDHNMSLCVVLCCVVSCSISYCTRSCHTYHGIYPQVRGAFIELKFQRAQRDSLSELFLFSRTCPITSAREGLRESLRSSERPHFACCALKGQSKNQIRNRSCKLAASKLSCTGALISSTA